VENVGQYVSGHQYGACTSGRSAIQTAKFSYSSANWCASSPSSSYDIWMLAIGNSESASVTSIERPVSDKTI
jgi:hypothetical protein